MNLYQAGFKGEMMAAIFKLVGKTWMKITGAYAIRAGISMIFMLILFATVFSTLKSEIDIEELSQLSDPQEVLDFYGDILDSVLAIPGIYAILAVLACVMFLLVSWFTNAQYIMCNDQITKGKIQFGDALKRSIGKDVFVILGFFVAMYLLAVLLFFVAGLLGSLHRLLGFLGGVASIMFLFRFILVVPALVVGGKSFSESIAWSISNITWLRSLKILGIGVLAFIILIMASLVIFLFSMIFSFIPVIGQVVQFGVQIAIGGISASILSGAIIGLYYRYSDDIQQETTLDVDDLLVSD